MRNRRQHAAGNAIRWARGIAQCARGIAQCAMGVALVLALVPDGASAAEQAAGDAARGKDLFTGAKPLQGGAMPCIGCHNATGVGALGGGTLATDLSDAGTRYDSVEVLGPLLKDVPFPAMQAVYGPRALTDAEIADLAAYLVAQRTEPRGGATLEFFGLGLLGMLILAGLSQILWRNRLRGVRRQLTGGR